MSTCLQSIVGLNFFLSAFGLTFSGKNKNKTTNLFTEKKIKSYFFSLNYISILPLAQSTKLIHKNIIKNALLCVHGKSIAI